jgi:hypothetical protein
MFVIEARNKNTNFMFSELPLLKFRLNSAITSSVGSKYPCYTVRECRVWELHVRNTGVIKFLSLCLHQLLLSLN